MTNDEILKLAEKCGVSRHAQHKELEAFYRAAFNAGIGTAAKVCVPVKDWEDNVAVDVCIVAIRNLEMK